MSDSTRPPIRAKGRGAQTRPPNRFGGPVYEGDLEHLASDPEALEQHLNSLRSMKTEYIPDRARTVVTRNDSPDIPFTHSLNPYRGCQHGCAYCYARPTHEYLGLDAGLDFETKILVKEDAPELLRAFLARPAWEAEPIILSGVTDPYQPGERRFGVTRGCLEVAADCSQPISLITKNALVLRDLDLLAPMAAQNLVHVNVSITTLDGDLAHSLEPRTSPPRIRLRAIRTLAEAGVPVRVMVAPIIPGLNDAEIPAILGEAAEAGARHAAYQIVRLPLTVEPVFLEWLEREQPDRREKIEARLRAMRDGRLNRSEFGRRMTGDGELARRIGELFHLFARRHGLAAGLTPHDRSRFRPPASKSGQQWLF